MHFVTLSPLALSLYVALRILPPLRLPLAAKAGLALLLLLAAAKFCLYRLLGGSFFAPDLPRPCLLVMETLFTALLILALLQSVCDMAQMALWGAGRCGLRVRLPAWGTRAALAGILLAVALPLGAWSVWQAVRVPDVHALRLSLPDVPKGLAGLRIVQITDIHIRTLLDREWLERVVAKVNALDPDVIALTGDYVDGPVAMLKDALSPLADLRARHGVYGVTGNHEYYYDAAAWAAQLRAFGVVLLCNEHRLLSLPGGRMAIAGIPDEMEGRLGDGGPDVAAALRGVPRDAPVLLLSHRPVQGGARAGVSLQLSGHTHGGMLFFLQPWVALFNGGFVQGLYQDGAARLYVSPGPGLWGGFSCRLGVPSEITLLSLQPGGADSSNR